MKLRIASLLTITCLAALPGFTQTPRFTGFLGGGFSDPVKALGGRLDRGWNATAGAGINFNNHFGALVDFSFNDFGISRTALNQAGAPGGTTRIWAFTLDPVVHLANVESRADVYLTGGGGIYHRTVEFTQPAVATLTVVDPWWGIVYPANFLTNQVIGSYSTYKPGFNVGAGVAFKISGNTKLFAEARYHHMFTNGLSTTYVPVTFGLRW